MILKLLIITLGIAPTASVPVTFNSPMDSSITATIPGIQNRTTLSILATINYGGNFFPAGPYCSKAMELALDRLHLDPRFLDGKFRLSVDLIDDKCDDATIVQSVLSELLFSKHRLPVFILNDCPAQGQHVLAEVIKYQNILGFTYYAAEGFQPTDRRDSKLIQLLLPSLMRFYDGIVTMIRHFEWRKICVFSENLPYFNGVEKFLFKVFELNNVSIAWMDKVTYKSTDDVEMNSAVQDMKKHDPRIIFSNTDSPVSLSCWLFRNGLYGPDYVIVASIWGNFNPETVKIPDYVASWCTRDMIKKVLPSWIFFGVTLMTDILGDSYVDSTGLSVPMFKEAMKEKVIEPNFENVFMWQCYDTAMFVGKTVDLGFKMAQQKNQPLTDLKNDPDVFEQAAFSVQVNGTKAIYDIDPILKSNSRGYNAFTYIQKRQTNTSLSDFIFGYYKASHDKYIDLNGGPEWRTVDNKVPRDKVNHVRVVRPANSLEVCIIFGVLSGIAVIACILIIIGIIAKTQASDSIFSIIILIGNIALLSHVYLIPIDSRQSNSINLFVISLLILLGFSLSNLGILFKLQESLMSVRVNSWKGLQLSISKGKQLFALVAWSGINIGLLAALYQSSVFVVKERFWNPYASDDGNTIFKPFQLVFALGPMSLTLKIVTLSIAAVHAIILLGDVLFAYQLTVNIKPNTMSLIPSIDLNVVERMKADATAAYTQALTILALAVAVMTATDNGERMTVIVAAFLLTYTCLYFIICHLKQEFQHRLTEEEQQEIRRVNMRAFGLTTRARSRLSKNNLRKTGSVRSVRSFNTLKP